MHFTTKPKAIYRSKNKMSKSAEGHSKVTAIELVTAAEGRFQEIGTNWFDRTVTR
jgi:hypothetical protein